MVTECPICKLPCFHGVAGYAGPQCKCQFATLPQVHDKLRADFDAQAAELAKWEKAFTEVHKPALEEAHQYIGDLRAELAEARAEIERMKQSGWRNHSVNYARAEKCPQTLEAAQAAWDRDQELIEDMRKEISRLKETVNDLRQKLGK